MKQSYLCHCDLQDEEHMVLKTERIAHNLALQRFKAQQVSQLLPLLF